MHAWDEGYSVGYARGYKEGLKASGKIPNDIVHVVRCKDCENWKNEFCTMKRIYTLDNFFCALGRTGTEPTGEWE